MEVNILTIFPGIFSPFFKLGIVGKTVEKGLLEFNIINIREFSDDSYGTVDDYPFGGGAGMIMKVEPIVRAIEGIGDSGKKILLSPRGALFDQDKAYDFKNESILTFICGRYKGVDERVRDFVDEEISIGNYVLSGGEVPSMVIIEAISRLLPGAVNDPDSVESDSFQGDLMDYPHYTRPRTFRDKKVPSVLLSGNHEKIRNWREEKAKKITEKYRKGE